MMQEGREMEMRGEEEENQGNGDVRTGTVLLLCSSVHWQVISKAAAVADLGGVRGVQMHPPLAASNVYLCK